MIISLKYVLCFSLIFKPQPYHPRINSGASPLFYLLLLKRYATANNPAIANITSNPGTPFSSGVGVGLGVGAGVTIGVGETVTVSVGVGVTTGVGAGVGVVVAVGDIVVVRVGVGSPFTFISQKSTPPAPYEHVSPARM